MVLQAYRYKFGNDVDLEDARDMLLLALLAAEGIFGRSRVRMDSAWSADESIDVILIDASTVVGMTVSLIFTAFVTAEFGAGSFDVRRVQTSSHFFEAETPSEVRS